GGEVPQVLSGRRESPNPAAARPQGVGDVEVAFLVEGQATRGGQSRRGEVAQVFASRGEFTDRVADDVGNVEIPLPVEGQTSGSVQPGGGEVAQVHSVRRELPNRGAALVGDEQVLCRRRDGETEHDEKGPQRRGEAGGGSMGHGLPPSERQAAIYEAATGG